MRFLPDGNAAGDKGEAVGETVGALVGIVVGMVVGIVVGMVVVVDVGLGVEVFVCRVIKEVKYYMMTLCGGRRRGTNV